MKNELCVTCSVCGSDILKMIGKYRDDRYGYPGTFNLYACSKCSHIFLDVLHDDADLQRLYTDYYPRSFISLQEFQPSRRVSGFSAWFNGAKCSAYCWVPENVRVLDIGCGFGQTLGYHKTRGCDVYGVEADENVRRVADKFGFNVHVGLFDPKLYEPGFFDYVTLDQVIEHVSDPAEIFKGISLVLKPGGMAIFSTPNSNGWGARLFGCYWINWHAPYHLQHFSRESMRIASERAGLHIESVSTVTSSEWLYYQWIHLLTYPEIGKPSQFWSPIMKKNLKTKIVLKLLSFIHITKTNHIITRLFDVLGIGDSNLFFLRKI